jgi:hypothetical protein
VQVSKSVEDYLGPLNLSGKTRICCLPSLNLYKSFREFFVYIHSTLKGILNPVAASDFPCVFLRMEEVDSLLLISFENKRVLF